MRKRNWASCQSETGNMTSAWLGSQVCALKTISLQMPARMDGILDNDCTRYINNFAMGVVACDYNSSHLGGWSRRVAKFKPSLGNLARFCLKLQKGLRLDPQNCVRQTTPNPWKKLWQDHLYIPNVWPDISAAGDKEMSMEAKGVVWRLKGRLQKEPKKPQILVQGSSSATLLSCEGCRELRLGAEPTPHCD